MVQECALRCGGGGSDLGIPCCDPQIQHRRPVLHLSLAGLLTSQHSRLQSGVSTPPSGSLCLGDFPESSPRPLRPCAPKESVPEPWNPRTLLCTADHVTTHEVTGHLDKDPQIRTKRPGMQESCTLCLLHPSVLCGPWNLCASPLSSSGDRRREGLRKSYYCVSSSFLTDSSSSSSSLF